MHSVCMHVQFKNIKRSVPATCVKCSVRRYPESGLNGFGLWARLNEWLHGLGPSPSENDLASSFTADVNAAVDHFFPANTVRFHPTDKPLITALIKELIKERQHFTVVMLSSGAFTDVRYRQRLKQARGNFMRKKYETH